jgi:hypothetical protein
MHKALAGCPTFETPKALAGSSLGLTQPWEPSGFDFNAEDIGKWLQCLANAFSVSISGI